ncbi:MAG: ABC transporter permease [Spirochaetales bacterium]|nr:ABC transporter permease [Spirochaetales bacterium]
MKLSDAQQPTVATRKHGATVAAPAAAVAILLAVWQFAVAAEVVPAFVLPSPLAVLRTTIAQFGTMTPHIVVTAAATLSGLGIALASAVILTFAMITFPLLRRAMYPLLVVSQTVPLIALAPLFVIWFGFGLLPKVLVVALVCFFPIVVSLTEGAAAVDTDTIDLLRSMGARRWQVFTRARVPASIPYLFGGLRIAATYSVMAAVIGEWLGGTRGLGVYMVRAQKAFALDRVFAAILVVVVLSLAVLGVIVAAQYVMSPHRRAGAEASRGAAA